MKSLKAQTAYTMAVTYRIKQLQNCRVNNKPYYRSSCSKESNTNPQQRKL